MSFVRLGLEFVDFSFIFDFLRNLPGSGLEGSLLHDGDSMYSEVLCVGV